MGCRLTWRPWTTLPDPPKAFWRCWDSHLPPSVRLAAFDNCLLKICDAWRSPLPIFEAAAPRHLRIVEWQDEEDVCDKYAVLASLRFGGQDSEPHNMAQATKLKTFGHGMWRNILSSSCLRFACSRLHARVVYCQQHHGPRSASRCPSIGANLVHGSFHAPS